MTAGLLVAEVLRLFTGFLLALAVVGKWRALDAFRDNLVDSFGLSPAAGGRAALLLIAVEAGLALAILAGPASWGMAGALLLFTGLTGLLAYKFLREGVVRCGCFGDTQRSVSGFDLARNGLTILGIAAYLALGEPAMAASPQTPLLAALAGLLTVIVARFHDIGMLLLHASDGPL